MESDIWTVPLENEIMTARILPFPIGKVYDAWTYPDLLKQWWGPKDFTNTFHQFDFQEGGRWIFTMHGPGGVGKYENDCEFIFISPQKKIAWKRYSKPIFQVVAEFSAIGEDQTKVIFKQIFETAEQCDKIKKFTVGKNEENFDRLADLLRTL